jgi:hypothetical protein
MADFILAKGESKPVKMSERESVSFYFRPAIFILAIGKKIVSMALVPTFFLGDKFTMENST